jgi:molybdate-binding protein/transcriptional regulator with XRE-family HTH domain
MANERLNTSALVNRVREERLRRGWSQEELARRAGLSRTGVSAIEIDRLVPSTAAALALALAFGLRVEDLFALPKPTPAGVSWAWAPLRAPSRFWQAEIGGRTRLYPVEASGLGVVPHDGMAGEAEGEIEIGPLGFDPRNTLVMACCDPAVGLLAEALMRESGIRLVALSRSSGSALELLGKELVHVAGVHLAHASGDDGNARAVRGSLGPGHHLLRAARWMEGVAVGRAHAMGTVGEAVRAGLRWVGREPGSGARQCLDELLAEGPRARPRRFKLANDHRGVAEAIRAGWADAGVCLRLAGEEAGLDFLSVREEAYDLCVSDAFRDDPRIEALLNVLRSTAYRRLLGGLPGYDSAETGEVRRVV